MVNDILKSRMHARLTARLTEIAKADDATSASRATVTLDQQAVGRLSRMDALQQQAMANATRQRRQQEVVRIKAARRRLDNGDYGACLECGDDIALERLEFDPTIAKCITCARR